MGHSKLHWSPSRSLDSAGSFSFLECLDGFAEGFLAYDSELRLTYMNAAAERMLEDWPQVFELSRREAPAALMNKQVGECYRRVMATRLPEVVECSSGNKCWLQVDVRPLNDGGLGVYLRDVSGQRSAEEAFRISQDRYALAMEASQDGYWDWLPLSKQFYISPRMLEIFGFSADTVFKDLHDFCAAFPIYPEDREDWDKAVSAHMSSGKPRFEMELRANVSGDTRWIKITGLVSRDENGASIRWTGSATDLTDRKRTELRLHDAQRLETVGTLASGIAHDFNNILAAILGYGEAALRFAPGGSLLQRDIQGVMLAGERGRALVERILAFSRSGTAKKAPVHVDEVVREALADLAARLSPQVTVETRLTAGRAAVMGDHIRILQVLMNVTTNAVQAMARGGTLRVESEAIEVDEARPSTTGTIAAGPYVMLKISDSGSGMDADTAHRIFEPFFTTKEPGAGTGLGLSLVHGIVMDLGGAIDLLTAPGAGCQFTIYLPRAGDAPLADEPFHGLLPMGNRQAIMVVDDERSLVHVLSEALEHLNYEPIGFTSSIEALEAIQACPARFDAVITDSRMPGLGGAGLIRKIRTAQPTIPVLLVSGYLDADDVKDARSAGANDVLKKPLRAHDLAVSLSRIFAKELDQPGEFE